MKCHEAKRRLDVFMDGELEVAENLRLLEHLNLCRACGEVFEGEKRLRASMKAALGATPAPAGLSARLAASPGPAPEEPEAFDPRRLRRWGTVAAAAAFFLLLGSLLFSPSPSFQLLATELAERHAKGEPYACGEESDERRCLCGGCTGDVAEEARAFFARRAGRDFCAHAAEAAKLGYAFLGVSAWRCRGEEVCWSSWRTPAGGRVSHALVALEAPLKAPRSVAAGGGRTLVFHPRGDAARPALACVFIFEDAAEALRFAAALGLPLP